jgi:hypothetical protein
LVTLWFEALWWDFFFLCGVVVGVVVGVVEARAMAGAAAMAARPSAAKRLRRVVITVAPGSWRGLRVESSLTS